MNDERSFERFVADHVADSAGGIPMPDDFYDEMHDFARRTRQRPEWLALIKEPPMRTKSRLAAGSPTARVVAVLAATILLAVALAAVGIAGQRLVAADRIIVVDRDGNGTVTSIAEAVAMAESGDEILVRAGTYDESIDIAKDVTIRGEGDRADVVVEVSAEMSPVATATDPDLPYALRLEGSDATVANLTLRGDASRVVVVGGSPRFSDVHFDDIGRVFGLDPGTESVPAGFQVEEGSTATIDENDFTSSTLVILSGSSPTVSGNTFDPGAIHADGAGTDPVIVANTIVSAGTHNAVDAWGGARPEIRGNTITSETVGIHVRYGGFPSQDVDPWPTIVDNTIEDSRTGIQLIEGAGGEIRDNRLLANDTGIHITNPAAQTGSEASVERNAVRGGLNGVIVSGAVSPEITGNEVVGAAQNGLWILQESTPVLAGNTVCENGVNLLVVGDSEPSIDASNEICEDAAE